MQLSVVIPCLNEIETIGAVVKTALATLEKEGISGEVIVADNGSSDGSQDAARALGARVVDIPVKGYGSALNGGIAASRGVNVIFADADCSYDFGQMGKFLAKLQTG